jgi:C4-dicarboxylate-specific signal transduction histidine kinase
MLIRVSAELAADVSRRETMSALTGSIGMSIGSDVRASDVDVSVRDTGPGLPAHMLGGPFMPFVTTKAHGLGIGLTIVQTIVAAHGGTVVARNHPEGGAIFTVTLRRSASAPVAEALH